LDFIGDGSAEDSDLFYLLVSEDEEELMPPPEHSKLTANQIALIKTWIDAGSDWPEDVKLVDTSQSEEEAADGTADNTGSAGDETANDKKSNDKKAPAELTTDQKTQQIFNAIGSLHPAAIHLPIGLLLASGLFAFFSLRGNFVMSDCAYYCLWLGTLGAIFGCVSGWWFSPMEHRGDVNQISDLFDQSQEVFWHRTGGLIVTAFALLLALFAAGARNRDPDDGIMWKLGLIVLACGIGWVGHTGGELHYPSSHYKDLEAIVDRIFGGGDEEEAKQADDQTEKSAEDDGEQTDEAEEVGKSSNESED
jgi:uncharacterized membrane protein